jgi:hypothetical protein
MSGVGSKAQVFHGTKERTAGGLKKEDLMQNKHGRIVSKKQHSAGQKAISRLRAAGFVAKKGEFKLFSKKSGSKKAPAGRTTKVVTRSVAATRKAKAAATRKAKKNAVPMMGGARPRVIVTRSVAKARKNKAKVARNLRKTMKKSNYGMM